eukprot:1355229-Amphidinium_carterae.1
MRWQEQCRGKPVLALIDNEADTKVPSSSNRANTSGGVEVRPTDMGCLQQQEVCERVLRPGK